MFIELICQFDSGLNTFFQSGLGVDNFSMFSSFKDLQIDSFDLSDLVKEAQKLNLYEDVLEFDIPYEHKEAWCYIQSLFAVCLNQLFMHDTRNPSPPSTSKNIQIVLNTSKTAMNAIVDHTKHWCVENSFRKLKIKRYQLWFFLKMYFHFILKTETAISNGMPITDVFYDHYVYTKSVIDNYYNKIPNLHEFVDREAELAYMYLLNAIIAERVGKDHDLVWQDQMQYIISRIKTFRKE